jgi:hypothetical protein
VDYRVNHPETCKTFKPTVAMMLALPLCPEVSVGS